MSKHHKMKQSVRYFLTMILCLCMLAGCGSRDTAQTLQTGNAAAEYHTEIVETDKNESTAEQTQADDTEKQTSTDSPSDFEPADVPDYSGDPYIAVNNNEPYFTADDLTTEAFENYSELDALGRCGTAYANVCLETMPTEKRGSSRTAEQKPYRPICRIQENSFFYGRNTVRPTDIRRPSDSSQRRTGRGAGS